ncbi:MAG: hypothetical protein JEY96_18610 [Bacteroidales bacterium]|nr:hypothetical protein [Bacteroidales bacterium]
MKRYFKYKIIGLTLLIASFVSCNTADQDVESIVEVNNSYPVVNFTTNFTGNTASEGDTIEYHMSLNKPINKDLTFSAYIISGTADASDIEVVTGTIIAYETETNVSVIFTQDWLADDSETIEIEFGLASLGEKYLVHPSTTNPVLNLTISNFVPDLLTITCDWEKDVIINSNEVYHEDYTFIEHASANMDFDIFVFDEADNKVASAETGSCPEVIEISGADLPNGTYNVYSFLYANDFAHWNTDNEPETINHIDVPFTCNFSEQGVFNDIAVKQSPDQVTNTSALDYDNDGVVDLRAVATFTVTEGVVNVLNIDGTGLGGGKMIPSHKIQRK